MKPNKVTKLFIIENENGLHARPSASFVRKATEFQSQIEVYKEGCDEHVNGKSVLGLITLSASKGTKLWVSAEGADAEEAIFALEYLFNNKFGESD